MPQIVEVESFSEIEHEFIEHVHKMVWCNVATDGRNRPGSRILHAIWEGATGWTATRRNAPKARQLAHSPYASLAYIADVWNPVYVDCIAEWDDMAATKRRIWGMFLSAPPPLGYDPAPSFHSLDHPELGVLKLMPWRVVLADTPARNRVWTK